MGFQEFHELCHGFGAVGMRFFKRNRQAGSGFTAAVFGNEDGIIAKSVAAFCFKGDGALPFAAEKVCLALRVDKAKAGNKSCAAVLLPGKSGQDGLAAFLLGFKALVSGGIDAGLIVQRRNFQAAVIGNNGTMRFFVDGFGFEHRIFFKCGTCFLHIQIHALFFLRNHSVSKRGEDILKFLDLALIAAGDDKFHAFVPPENIIRRDEA